MELTTSLAFLLAWVQISGAGFVAVEYHRGVHVGGAVKQ